MKIFYPLEVFFPSQAGGPANTIYWITKNLLPRGFRPVIVATDKGIGEKIETDFWHDTDGGRAIYVTTRALNFPLRQTFIALRQVRSADVVHVSSFFYPAAFSVGILARLMRKKLVWSARGELDTIALRHSRIKKFLVLSLIKLVVGRYPLFHSTCDEETQYIRNAFGQKARVAQISNYLELPVKLDREKRPYFLYIGRIHPKKAIDNLITAVGYCRSAFEANGYRLLIAGKGKEEFEGPLRALVAELGLQNLIEFIGQIEGSEKEEMLAGAYFTVMPSHTENFGVVVLESLAQGTPVIASKGSPWSVLEEEGLGSWIENTPDEIAGALTDAFSLPAGRYREMCNRARPFVESRFDIKENIGKWVDLYNSL